MKRRCAGILAGVLLCLLLAGCSNAGQKFADYVAQRNQVVTNMDGSTSAPATSASAAEPIPIVSYTNGSFAPTLGFNVVSFPNNTQLYPKKFFALDDWFAQIEFATQDGLDIVLRTAFTDAGYLTATYKELHDASDSTRDVGGIEVRTRNATSGCSMVTWNVGEFQFLLHSRSYQGILPTSIVDEFVQQTRCQAV